MKSFRCCLLILLLMFSHTSIAFESSEPPMRLALGHLPPVNCDDSEAGSRCINNAIIKRLQYFSGINIQIRLVPYARVVRMLQGDQADMALMLKNDSMPNDIIAIAKVFETKFSIYTRLSDEKLPFSQLRIGLLRGQDSSVSRLLAGARLFELAEYRQGVEMIALGRLDAILLPDEVIIPLLGQPQLNNILSPRPLLQFNQEVWLYCHRDVCNTQRLKQLQQAIISIQPEIPTIKKVALEGYYN